MQNAAD
jgi:hypothetical protein